MNDQPRLEPTQVAKLVQDIPYARFLGIEVDLRGDELTLILPYRQVLIGNPVAQALHGGVVGAFLELSAVAQIWVEHGAQRMPKTIDVSFDYLRTGRPVDTFARAQLRKVGKRIAHVHAEAWQSARAEPIATLRGNFLISEGVD